VSATQAGVAQPLILLVDDSALVRDALRLLFEETGHRVATAGSVAESLIACRVERPSVMLLDLTLPDGDGLDAIPLLRDERVLPPVVVALTGHDDERTIERCRQAGCRDVLVKPVPTRELLGRVRGWLEEIRKGGTGDPGPGTGE
jgi:DNA-binding response OmpR family regulator